LEIKKAIEQFYGVNVVDVNTAVVPGKNKTRYTKAGFIQGMKGAYKKALVTVAVGESIDLYANI
jgi:large subunit ribosomal protein L23